jgi:hypothetical protein
LRRAAQNDGLLSTAMVLAIESTCLLTITREPISAPSVNLLDRLSRMLGHSHTGSEFFVWSIILLYFAEVTLLIQIGLFALISARFPLFWIALLHAAQFLMMALPFWHYRSQRLLPRTIDERQLWSIRIGFLLACSSVAVVSHTLFGVDRLSRADERLAAARWRSSSAFRARHARGAARRHRCLQSGQRSSRHFLRES